MVEQRGIVIEAGPDGWARVITDRKGACGGCHTSHGGCSGCLSTAKMESRVANPVGAKPGDIVRVTLRSSDLFKGAALLYLLPVVLLMGAALAGSAIAVAAGAQDSYGSILGAAVGLAAGFFIVIRADRSQWARKRLSPAITAVVASGGQLPFH